MNFVIQLFQKYQFKNNAEFDALTVINTTGSQIQTVQALYQLATVP